MKCPVGISNFLEEISHLSHSVVLLYFFALMAEEGFLFSPCYSLELCTSCMPRLREKLMITYSVGIMMSEEEDLASGSGSRFDSSELLCGQSFTTVKMDREHF